MSIPRQIGNQIATAQLGRQVVDESRHRLERAAWTSLEYFSEQQRHKVTTDLDDV